MPETALPSSGRVVNTSSGIKGPDLACYLARGGWANAVMSERAALAKGSASDGAGRMRRSKPATNG